MHYLVWKFISTFFNWEGFVISCFIYYWRERNGHLSRTFFLHFTVIQLLQYMLSPLTSVFPCSITLRKIPYSVGSEDLFCIHSYLSALLSSWQPCSKQESRAQTSGTKKKCFARDVKNQRNNWVSNRLENFTEWSSHLWLGATTCHLKHFGDLSLANKKLVAKSSSWAESFCHSLASHVP